MPPQHFAFEATIDAGNDIIVDTAPNRDSRYESCWELWLRLTKPGQRLIDLANDVRDITGGDAVFAQVRGDDLGGLLFDQDGGLLFWHLCNQFGKVEQEENNLGAISEVTVFMILMRRLFEVHPLVVVTRYCLF
jgi:hypothetical protein